MSYILEALKKSERERRQGQVPDPTTAPPEPVSRGTRWRWWFGAAVVANLVLLAVLFLRPRAPEARHVPVTAAVPAVPAVPGHPPPLVRPASHRPPAVRRPAPADAAVPSSSGKRVASRARPAAVPAPVPARRRPALPSPSANAPAPVAVPLYRELPASLRARIAPPAMDVHVYAPRPERRFILVALRKYREGDRLPSGLRLLHITPTGAVFSFEGHAFRVTRR